jgi:hypothetical protein
MSYYNVIFIGHLGKKKGYITVQNLYYYSAGEILPFDKNWITDILMNGDEIHMRQATEDEFDKIVATRS